MHYMNVLNAVHATRISDRTVRRSGNFADSPESRYIVHAAKYGTLLSLSSIEHLSMYSTSSICLNPVRVSDGNRDFDPRSAGA